MLTQSAGLQSAFTGQRGLQKGVTLGQVGTPCNKFRYVFLAVFFPGSLCGTTECLVAAVPIMNNVLPFLF